MALYLTPYYMSRIVRKPDFCLCENKGADQLRSNCEADQRLCFRHSDSTISLLPKSEISSFLPFSETAQTGLCRTWSETPKTGFLASWLIMTSLLSSGERHVIKSVMTTRVFYMFAGIHNVIDDVRKNKAVTNNVICQF